MAKVCYGIDRRFGVGMSLIGMFAALAMIAKPYHAAILIGTIEGLISQLFMDLLLGR